MTHAETITHCVRYYDRTIASGISQAQARRAVDFGLKSGLIRLPYRKQCIQKTNTKEAK